MGRVSTGVVTSDGHNRSRVRVNQKQWTVGAKIKRAWIIKETMKPNVNVNFTLPRTSLGNRPLINELPNDPFNGN